MTTTASKIELSPAMETSLNRQRARLRARFAPIEGTDHPACEICPPPKSAVFHDKRTRHNLCGKCAAKRWELSWAQCVAGVAFASA